MKHFKLAGLTLKISSEIQMPEEWESFVEQNGDLQTAFSLHRLNPVTVNQDICYSDITAMKTVMLSGASFLLADSDYQNVYIWQNINDRAIETLSAYVFYTHAVRHQMLQLHCATIDDRGRGVLFLGPSGIGKTTQAERWAAYRGASIINGDVGFVQRTPQGFTAWGTPWHGSSPYCLNAGVPVRALVVLKQSPHNALRALTGFERVQEVSESVFYPTWLEDGMALCTETLNHLLTDLPVYRLDNRADQAAVALLAEELDRITEG